MESSMWKKAGKFLREQGKNKRWRKVLAVLGAGVVVVTGYAMLRPSRWKGRLRADWKNIRILMHATVRL